MGGCTPHSVTGDRGYKQNQTNRHQLDHFFEVFQLLKISAPISPAPKLTKTLLKKLKKQALEKKEEKIPKTTDIKTPEVAPVSPREQNWDLANLEKTAKSEMATTNPTTAPATNTNDNKDDREIKSQGISIVTSATSPRAATTPTSTKTVDFKTKFNKVMTKLISVMGVAQNLPDDFVTRFSDAPGAVFLRYIVVLGEIVDQISRTEGLTVDDVYRELGILCTAMALTPQIKPGQTFPWRGEEVNFKIVQKLFSMTGEKTSNVGPDKIPYSFYQKLGLGGAAQVADQLGNMSFYRLYCQGTQLPKWFCSPLMLLLPCVTTLDNDLKRVVSNFETKVKEKYKNKKNPDKNIRSWDNIYSRGRDMTIDSAILGKMFLTHPQIGQILDEDRINEAFNTATGDLVPIMASFANITRVFSAGTQDQPIASRAGDFGVQPSEIARRNIQTALEVQAQTSGVP